MNGKSMSIHILHTNHTTFHKMETFQVGEMGIKFYARTLLVSTPRSPLVHVHSPVNTFTMECIVVNVAHFCKETVLCSFQLLDLLHYPFS